MIPADPLGNQAADFAERIERTVRGVLPGEARIVPLRVGDRVVVTAVNSENEQTRVPLYVGGDHVADLSLSLFQSLDRTGQYLKTQRSDFVTHSVLDRQPLVRLDYRHDMSSAPISHWQIHAERGSFSSLLTRAHTLDPKRVQSPHMLSSLHFPVGGERFRPSLEDFLEFLVSECGVDRIEGWETVLAEGREIWRRFQLRTVVRELQVEAAEVLKLNGWTVTPPPGEVLERTNGLTQW